jgi:hypothetical protein
MKDYGNKSRRERFDELDKPYAQSLPSERFRIIRIKEDVRVAPNYHIRYDDHYYSVPHEYAYCQVDVFQSESIVEIYYKGKHLCRHQYSNSKYQYTTVKEHMPYEHQFVSGWSKAYFLAQGNKIGPATMETMKVVMARHQHIQQGFNACMGILQLAQVYSKERLESACQRALYFNTVFCSHIKTILERHLDMEPLTSDEQPGKTVPAISHENVRGENYYQLEMEYTNA